MVKIQNFQENLEHDLRRLSAEIQKQKIEETAPPLPEREVVKRSLESISVTVLPPPLTTPLAPTSSQEASTNLPAYVQDVHAEDSIKHEIERLIDVAFGEGLEKALGEVKKHPPFVQDAFHDALVDKLLPELKKRGIIK